MSAVVLSLGAPAPSTAGPCGAFGKIASLGDFLRFEVSRDFVAAWDGWLQGVIPAAQRALGGRWTDLYMSAPIWRFTLAGGLAGPVPMLGVLMPSTDRVGRLYPLTLAAPLREAGRLAEAHFGQSTLFEAMEEIALASLDTLSPDDLRQRCRGVTHLADSHWDPAPGLAAFALPQGAGQTLWSARTDRGFLFLRADGLPDAAVFSALLDPGAAVWQEPPDQAGASI